MRHVLCMLLLPLLLFCSCAQDGGDTDIPSAVSAVRASYADGALVQADADLVTTNFGALDFVDVAEVWLTENGDGTEFGFFHLTDTRRAGELQARIRDYLANERQAVESLAALYPAEELQARLDRFTHAKVGQAGAVVYYLLADVDTVKQISDALRA